MLNYKNYTQMESTYKYLCRIAIMAIAALLLCSASCERINDGTNVKSKDVNPYSETRNENYSMIGFYWRGKQMTQWAHNHLFTIENDIRWNIVDINKENYIIVNANMGVSNIWFILPYNNVELEREYTASVYTSIAKLRFDEFLNEEGQPRIISVPMDVKVIYTYKKRDDKIQGRFSSEGEVREKPGSNPLSVIFQNGVFNLNYHNNFAKYTLDEWLSETNQLP